MKTRIQQLIAQSLQEAIKVSADKLASIKPEDLAKMAKTTDVVIEDDHTNSDSFYEIPETRLALGKFGTAEIAISVPDMGSKSRVPIYRGAIPHLIKALQKIENGELLKF